MESELSYNTQIFKDPKPCPNENCVDGYVYTDVFDEDGLWECIEKEICPDCNGEGHVSD